MEMLMDALQKKGTATRIKTIRAFLRLLIGKNIHAQPVSVLIYTSLMAPFIFLMRIARPTIPIYYMVRGDEITYVKRSNRHFRAIVALLFQKSLAMLNCHFVFVCEDLRVRFEQRLGPIRRSFVLPNTLGKRLPEIRPFDGRLALVGDFGTVKNIESAIQNLSDGKFEVHLYGNRTFPEKWRRPWLDAHGFVEDLTSALRRSVSLVVLPFVDAGFPNVVVEALEAGCACVVHREFPFEYLPIADEWRFSLSSSGDSDRNLENQNESNLESVLDRLLKEKLGFKHNNQELIQLIESDWEKKVWEIFG